ncbi:hypothetical protein ES708_30557 [subsurface metagenome]
MKKIILIILILVGVGFLVRILLPSFVTPRQVTNEGYVANALHNIISFQAIFKKQDRDKDGKKDYAQNIGELCKSGLLSSDLASGKWHGYYFVVVGKDGNGKKWHATASPIKPGITGYKYFYVDETGVIRFEKDKPATKDNPPVD